MKYSFLGVIALAFATFFRFKSNFTEIRDLAKMNNTKVILAKDGDVFAVKQFPRNPDGNLFKGAKNNLFNGLFNESEDISFFVLSPAIDEYSGDSNACSLVVLVCLKEGNILFMGDSDSAAEEKVISFLDKWNANHSYFGNKKSPNDCLQISVLQSAHHGSCKNTNSENFIQIINPRIAVISCGFNNSYGHPHKETLDILEKENVIIKRTDYDGCISIFP